MGKENVRKVKSRKGIGAQIYQLRVENGWTMKRAAEEWGVSLQAVGEYERGRCTPNFTTVGRIADKHGVSVDWLLGRTKTRELE